MSRKITFLSLFPELFDAFLNESIVGRARQGGFVTTQVVNWREFGSGKQQQVDDIVYGGGKGMLLMVEPIVKAIEADESLKHSFKVLVSPQGAVFSQQMARQWLDQHQNITFIAGRYEGFDERILDYVDAEISIGDYVLTGGELPAMVMADAYIRLIPGVIQEQSHQSDSFENGLLDFAQYTRPREFRGASVPEVLVNGHHAKIDAWRLAQAELKTKTNRPDLFKIYERNKHAK